MRSPRAARPGTPQLKGNLQVTNNPELFYAVCITILVICIFLLPFALVVRRLMWSLDEEEEDEDEEEEQEPAEVEAAEEENKHKHVGEARGVTLTDAALSRM